MSENKTRATGEDVYRFLDSLATIAGARMLWRSSR
jgi:hypothetical protein